MAGVRRWRRTASSTMTAWTGAILEPHWRRTQARMGEHAVVLCLQDTTELDFNGQRARGLGPLSHEAQRGMYLPPTYAVTPAREPLGVLDAWMWAREGCVRRRAQPLPAGRRQTVHPDLFRRSNGADRVRHAGAPRRERAAPPVPMVAGTGGWESHL